MSSGSPQSSYSTSSPQKLRSSNICLSPWMVDNTLSSHLPCRPPRAVRWKQGNINNFSLLSGSLPVLNDKEFNKPSTVLKSARTVGTQTPSSCESIELNENEIYREKYHSISLSHITNTNQYDRRASDVGSPTNWHQLGKELRQIADELKKSEKIRSSSAQSLLNLGSSAESGLSHLSPHNKSFDYLRPKSISASSSFNDLLNISRKK